MAWERKLFSAATWSLLSPYLLPSPSSRLLRRRPYSHFSSLHPQSECTLPFKESTDLSKTHDIHQCHEQPRFLEVPTDHPIPSHTSHPRPPNFCDGMPHSGGRHARCKSQCRVSTRECESLKYSEVRLVACERKGGIKFLSSLPRWISYTCYFSCAHETGSARFALTAKNAGHILPFPLPPPLQPNQHQHVPHYVDSLDRDRNAAVQRPSQTSPRTSPKAAPWSAGSNSMQHEPRYMHLWMWETTAAASRKSVSEILSSPPMLMLLHLSASQLSMWMVAPTCMKQIWSSIVKLLILLQWQNF